MPALPTAKQVELARYVHRMNEAGQKQRWDLLGRFYGSLNEADGQAFEDALRSSRLMASNLLDRNEG